MPLSTTAWTEAWGDDFPPSSSSVEPAPRRLGLSARVATTVAAAESRESLVRVEDIDTVLMEISKLRNDLARRDAITIVVVGVLLTAILQHISRMHEEFHLMASRVGILR